MSEDMQWFIKGLYVLARDFLVSLQSDTDTAASIMERYGFSVFIGCCLNPETLLCCWFGYMRGIYDVTFILLLVSQCILLLQQLLRWYSMIIVSK